MPVLLLIWIMVRQWSTVLAVDAGGTVLIFFSFLSCGLSFLPLSGRQLGVD